MLKALNTAATGMAAQEKNVNGIAHNIANVNTVGFKKRRTEFQDLLYETLEEPGGRSSANTRYNIGIQIGSGAKVAATRTLHTQGSPKITKNAFDLMINGNGFFGIVDSRGEVKYTRNGEMSVDATGNLVTSMGFKVFPGISFPANTSTVNIAENGLVEAFSNGNPQPQGIGQIPVFTFINPSGLRSIGGNLFSVGPASGAPIQNIAGENNSGSIQQGQIESSNVSIMTEMTDMIKAQRAYEMNSKVVSVADQMLQTINNIR